MTLASGVVHQQCFDCGEQIPLPIRTPHDCSSVAAHARKALAPAVPVTAKGPAC